MGAALTSTINSSGTHSASGIRQFGALPWLALGTFATGTESFMIAALLPGLASDLSVTLTAAGQLVTIFALTYAVSSPALSGLTAGMGRRNLLLISMTAFALANFFASTATDFWQLLGARTCLRPPPAFTCRARVHSPGRLWRQNAAAPLWLSSTAGPASRSHLGCRLARWLVTRSAGV